MKRLARYLSAFVVCLLNPILFLTFFGPGLISVAMRLIQSDGFNSVSPRPMGALSTLFDNKAMPGLVDYTTQFYTAMLVSVFWLRFCIEQGLLDHVTSIVRSHSSNANPESEEGRPCDVWRIFVTLCGLAIFLYLIYGFFCGGLATPKIMTIYIVHTPRLGVTHLPPFGSPITWIRIIVAVHCLCLKYTRIDEHGTGNKDT